MRHNEIRDALYSRKKHYHSLGCTMLRPLLILSLLVFFSLPVRADQDADQITFVKVAILHGDYQSALQLLPPLAEKGNPDAAFRLGSMYEYGEGVKHSYVVAAKWYRRAAEQGDVRAQCHLGLIYSQGWLGKADYAEAAKWFRKAALQGDPVAQNDLGHLYEGGSGVKQDWAEAYFWQYLGKMGGVEDLDDAPELTKRKWDQRLTTAQKAGIEKRAAEWNKTHPVLPRADQLDGAHGIPIHGNPQGVLQALRPLAEQGNAEAQRQVGDIYEVGWGVKQDYSEAYYWISLGHRFHNSNAWETAAARHLTPEQKAAADKRVATWLKDHPAPASNCTSNKLGLDLCGGSHLIVSGVPPTPAPKK